MSSDPDALWSVTAWSATALAREASGRDIVVRVGKDVHRGTAHTDFDPHDDVIRIDVADVGLSEQTPTVLVDSLISRLGAPVLAGVVLAGAARAAHSRWTSHIPADTPPELLSTAWQLDRARAKARLIARRPQDRLFLRAAVRNLHFRGVGVISHGDVTRRVAIELLPEVDCGVLPRWIGPELRQYIQNDLGPDMLAHMTDIWRQVQLVADNDAASMLSLAEQWRALWRQNSWGTADDAALQLAVPSLALDELLTQVGDLAIADAAVEVMAIAGSVRSPLQEAEAREGDLVDRQAGIAFGPSKHKPINHRTPTADDHRSRLTIVRRLRRAQYRAPHKIRVPVGYPTGRARGDALVQRAAQRAQGVAVTAMPWKQRRWRATPRPPILAGIVVDLSGSMKRWLPAAGTAMWSVAAAVAELGGSSAGAGFAGDVYPLLRPRAIPARVPILSVKGGSDGCADAMAAVTGAAQLTQPGAAVMVVLTDGDLPSRDRAPIDSHAAYLDRHDVQLIWVLTRARTSRSVVASAAQLVEHVTPESFPLVVADAIADALTRAEH